ncbi:putative LysR-like regular protein [Shewanella sediminis HAW-EB3]|uniref:Putative LysR-like regular protein n=1 Tax=Shewanella sediminis (strain HAW-EB3) TaxID=425104 RepID=A8FQR8_SHESH|nr:LysR family transcriptional regulator [Shewanella sediminis]ABV35191.1 putative LysR-like regular protein [Shewanella sediminis HAW-EB3]
MTNEINWKSTDLNLLVTFSYLYRYRSVSIAADKSHVSQSAMSHSLARLRILFDDQLFERKGHHMEPSEYAHHIAPIVGQLLDDISHRLLAKEQFTPLSYSGECRIGLTDYAEFIFAPSLYDAIQASAPKSQVSFINVNRHNYVNIADQDKLDVVIGSMPQPHSDFDSKFLYTEKHVCLCDSQLFSNNQTLTVAEFAAVEQALVSPDGTLVTQVDKRLADLGLTRKVSVASRNFLTIRSLLKKRKLIAIVPELMAKAQGFDDQLTALTPPVDIADFEISLLWKSKLTNNDKNSWLRSVVQNVLSNAKSQS